jgi:cytochrome c5
VDLDKGVVRIWRSASRSGDTKTPASKRSLELPKRAFVALTAHKARQAKERRAAGEAWHDNNFVFCHENGVVLGPVTADQSDFHVRLRLVRSGENLGLWCLVWYWFAGPSRQRRLAMPIR